LIGKWAKWKNFFSHKNPLKMKNIEMALKIKESH
jgi:hypothetical protein